MVFMNLLALRLLDVASHLRDCGTSLRALILSALVPAEVCASSPHRGSRFATLQCSPQGSDPQHCGASRGLRVISSSRLKGRWAAGTWFLATALSLTAAVIRAVVQVPRARHSCRTESDGSLKNCWQMQRSWGPDTQLLEPFRSARNGPRGSCRSSGLSQLCVTASAWAITRSGLTGLMSMADSCIA